jgi:penicillin-binding protein 2
LWREEKEISTTMDLKRREPEELRQRYRYFVFSAVIIFFFIFIRLWYLQVVKDHEFRLLSENNRIRLRKITAVRGMIMDREGRVIADNRPSFNVMVMPEDVDNMEVLSARLSQVLHLNGDEIVRKIKDSDRPSFQPVEIKRDISWKQLSLLKTYRLDLPGLELNIEPMRMYPQGNVAAHILGYVSEIDKKELKHKSDHKMGDYVGKCGVELQWERYLRGIRGGRQVEVDAVGKELRVLNEVPPMPGHSLYLTIDLNLQRYGEKLLGKKAGTIIAMDPTNGEILAFCSSPSFQPALFANGISDKEWETLASHPLHPLQNRGIQGLYPPGSVFKIITAAAALEEGVIEPNDILNCSGIYYVGNRGYQCWREKGHGAVNFYRGLVESCDIYFYQLGAKLGVAKLNRYAKGFGLGSITGIELKGEKAGLIPTAEWKRERLGEPWYLGETISLAIGQGYILVTPLQLLNLISAIANGGVLHNPHITKYIKDGTGMVLMEYRSKEIGRLPLSNVTLDKIKEALLGVIKDDHGTGRAAYIAGVEIAGKTGTAQVIKLKGIGERLKPEEMPYEQRDHAWFVAYAPAPAPKIAVVVLIEHGGHGGSAAAPLAREMIKKYLFLK